MNDLISEEIRGYLNRIIINGDLYNFSKIPSNGLASGKIGLAYFLFLYRDLFDEDYSELIELIIETVCKEVNISLDSDNFGDGLAGVAWALNQFISNHVSISPGASLSNSLDSKFLNALGIEPTLFKHNPASLDIQRLLEKRSLLQLSIHDGLLGYGIYLISRLRSGTPFENKYHILMTKEAIIKIIDEVYRTVTAQKCDLDSFFVLDPMNYLELKLFLSISSATKVYDFKINQINSIISHYRYIAIKGSDSLPNYQNSIEDANNIFWWNSLKYKRIGPNLLPLFDSSFSRQLYQSDIS